MRISSKFMVGAIGAWVASTVVTSDLGALTVSKAALASFAPPCEPELGATKRLAAPVNLRILPGEIDFSGPFSDSEPTVTAATAEMSGHAFFDGLSVRADCLVAYHLRSNDLIDRLETVKSGVSAKGEIRFPVQYDPAVDGAMFRIDPRVGSTDSEGKRLAMSASTGSMLFTWDLRFDNGHAYAGSGYLGRHKTYMIGWNGISNGDNRWIGLKTEYINAAQAGQGVAEIYAYLIGTTYAGPGTTLGSQSSILPSSGRFFIAANTWTRVWVYIEDIGQPVSYISLWAADPSRGPVQLQNRNAVITPAGGITKFWFEYDTSGENALNGDMRSWNRNFVALQNVPSGQVPGLLQRP